MSEEAKNGVRHQKREFKMKYVKGGMRVMVKALLRRYDYPPYARPAAVKIVLEQAALLKDVWAVG